MQNHDGRHAQCQDVHKISAGLKDDGVGQLHTAGVAIGLNACLAGNGRWWAHDGA